MDILQSLQKTYDAYEARIREIREKIDPAPERVWVQDYVKGNNTYQKLTSLNPSIKNTHLKKSEVSHWKERVKARDEIAELKAQQRIVGELIDRCCQKQRASA